MEEDEEFTADGGNNATNRSSESELDSFYFYQVEQFAVLWLLFVIIVAGNVGVLVTLLSTKAAKSRMNFFITHLAFADLLVGLINVLTDIIWRMTISWNAGNVACKIIRFAQVIVTYGSTYVLVALTIDRYDAIRHPMKSYGSWHRAKWLIVGAWMLSALFSAPMFVLYEKRMVAEKPQCWIDFPERWQWQLYMSLVALSVFILPAIIIAVCYGVIIKTIWSKSAAGRTTPGSDMLRRMSSRGLIPKAKIKTVKITLLIVSVFILCWSPYIIFDLMQVFGHVPLTQTNIAVATLIQSLAPLNSAANPIIYCLCSTHVCNMISNWRACKWIRSCQRRPKVEIELRPYAPSHTQSTSLSEVLTINVRRPDLH